jgi:FkbM family methyltransferase
MTEELHVPSAPGRLERALIWYARRFPISRGKLRLIDAAWRLALLDGNTRRKADLVYGGFSVACDLEELLQRQFYFFGTYFVERDLLSCWSSIASRATIIFDVGANAGIYSLAALAANPIAEVHAFEPTPEIAERLRETASLNRLTTLSVHEIAITERPGEASLIRFRGEHGSNEGMNYIRSGEFAGSERVNTDSLDAFCAARGIERVDLVKMDIQGGEAAALRGAERLLRERRIDTIFMELNWGEPGMHCPASESVKLLESFGYRFANPAAIPSWRASGDWMRNCADILAAFPTPNS